jgi:hypothetical protein
MVEDKKSKKKIFIFTGVILIVIAAGIGGWLYAHRYISPIPKSVQQSVTFPVYYPDKKKLPFGYTFNLKSFHNPRQNILLYAVDYGVGKKVVVSLQKKPSNDTINNFYTFTIPLTIQVKTTLGEARIGAAGEAPNQKTIVSLPTSDGVWILATAPDNINQDQLTQVIKSLRK